MKKLFWAIVTIVSIPVVGLILMVVLGILLTNSNAIKEKNSLKAEIIKLKTEIERLSNEPEVLFSKAYEKAKANRYEAAISLLQDIKGKYPDYKPDEITATINDYTSAKLKYEAEQEEQNRIAEQEAEKRAEQKRLEEERIAREKKEAEYSIIQSDTYSTLKRSVDVRLQKPVSESTLRNIALEIKAKDPRHYKRTFISYLLPDMQMGLGAWATTHFLPDLEVQINGLTPEQENFLRRRPIDKSRKIIGSWLDTSLYTSGRITIYSQDGKHFLEKIYYDGSGSPKEVLTDFSNNRKTFIMPGDNPAGEYYLIDNQGNLQLWDNEGIIWTAKKIN